MRREDELCCEGEDSRRPASEEGREARKENSGVEREEGRCGEEGWDSSLQAGRVLGEQNGLFSHYISARHGWD